MKTILNNLNNKHFFHVLGLICIISSYGYAQPNISNIDPSREGKQFIEQNQFKSEDNNKTSIAVKSPKKLKETRFSKTIFPLCEVIFQGVSVYHYKDLQKIFCPHITGNANLHKLYNIANLLTDKYRRDDYILSHVVLPAQKMQNGSVKMHVIEGCVGMTFVESASLSTSTKTLIEGYGEKITKSCPLHIDTLEHYVLLANDIPGVQVQTYVKPSAKMNNAADLHMIVTRKKTDINVILSNELPRKYGDLAITVGGFINDIYKGSRTGLSIKTSSNIERLQLYNLTHSQILNTNGLTLNLTGQYVKNKPLIHDGLPINYKVYGDSYLFVTNFTYPVIRTRQSSLTLHTTFDGLHSYSSADLPGNNIQKMRDKIYSLRVGSNFEYLDKFVGSNLFSLELSQGLPIFNATLKGDIDKSRLNGESNYTKINFNFSRLQYLPRNFSFLLMTEGQYSFQELLSAEEFGIGGSQLGRGYDPSELVGEHGIATTFELRYQNNVFKYLEQMQLYTFFDIGKVWNFSEGKITGADQPKQASLMSCGLGVRFNILKHFISKLELAKPLNRTLAATGNKDPKILFTVHFII